MYDATDLRSECAWGDLCQHWAFRRICACDDAFEASLVAEEQLPLPMKGGSNDVR